MYSFGCNDEGTLGRDTSEDGSETLPGKVDGLPKIVMVSAGDSHTAALSEQGQVFFWGNFRVSDEQLHKICSSIFTRLRLSGLAKCASFFFH